MIGWRQPKHEFINNTWVPTYGRSSWNLGVGLRVDPKVRVLGDGIVADQPLPAGETQVRFKDDAQLGVMVLSSFTF
jgi:hypothetical protein